MQTKRKKTKLVNKKHVFSFFCDFLCGLGHLYLPVPLDYQAMLLSYVFSLKFTTRQTHYLYPKFNKNINAFNSHFLPNSSRHNG